MISVHDTVLAGALGDLSGFRQEFFEGLTARADALFELTDAVLCGDGPVTSLAELSLTAVHRRGHGAGYDAINHGTIEVGRLRKALAGLPFPRAADGRIVLAVDVSAWLRPDAACSPERLFCHVYGRSRSASQFIPGWPYSFVAALETGRTSWTAILDAVRLGPADDATAVTAEQLREVVGRIIDGGAWQPGDPNIVIVTDAGYDVTRLAFVLADLPVELVGRIRSDRIMLRPAPPRPPGTNGRPRKHGGVFSLAEPDSWHIPECITDTDTTHYGHARAQAWNRLHPRLTHRGSWLDHDGELPIIEGTLIRLQVDHLPGDRNPTPVWLWSSVTSASATLIDLLWQAFLRRFDIEHTFRLFKQTLGWTRPKLRAPESADRWTWIIITAHTQLRLARPIAEDLRHPWEKPVTEPRRLTPARVRRGFRNLHPTITRPAAAPKPSHPGPGRPPGSTNRHPAQRHDVGKTTKRDTTLTQHQNRTG
jgi:DDE superfamily endonuclease